MAGLLSGLGKLGLKNLEEMELFETTESGKKDEGERPVPPEAKESDFLFDKTNECPVCDKKFTARTIKAAKARLIKTDLDLRPIYENIDPIKYDVISCPYCGYTALTRYYKGILSSQAKAVKENISSVFQPTIMEQDNYSYEQALDRYKLCLANTIVKRAKSSEKAYVCLKSAWLLRSQMENMTEEEKQDTAKVDEIKEQEKEYLRNALEGFKTARQSESFPMCGMDESTVEYLISVLAMEFEQFDVASRLISGLLVSVTANPRMKDKAREVKEMLIVKIKEKNANHD